MYARLAAAKFFSVAGSIMFAVAASENVKSETARKALSGLSLGSIVLGYGFEAFNQKKVAVKKRKAQEGFDRDVRGCLEGMRGMITDPALNLHFFEIAKESYKHRMFDASRLIDLI